MESKWTVWWPVSFLWFFSAVLRTAKVLLHVIPVTLTCLFQETDYVQVALCNPRGIAFKPSWHFCPALLTSGIIGFDIVFPVGLRRASFLMSTEVWVMCRWRKACKGRKGWDLNIFCVWGRCHWIECSYAAPRALQFNSILVSTPFSRLHLSPLMPVVDHCSFCS